RFAAGLLRARGPAPRPRRLGLRRPAALLSRASQGRRRLGADHHGAAARRAPPLAQLRPRHVVAAGLALERSRRSPAAWPRGRPVLLPPASAQGRRRGRGPRLLLV